MVRGIEIRSQAARNVDDVAIALEARCDGPENLFLIKNIDVFIHDHHMLREQIAAEDGHSHIPRLALGLLIDGNEVMESSAPRVGAVDVLDRRARALGNAKDIGLFRHGGHQAVFGRARGDGLIDRVSPVRHGLELDHGPRSLPHGVSGEFAKRALFRARVGQDLSFEDDLRIRHGLEIARHAAHEAKRFLHQPSHHVQLVDIDRHQRKGAQHPERMAPQDDGHGQGFIHALGLLMVNIEVFSRVDMNVGGLPVHDLAPDEGRIPHAGLGIFSHHKPRCDVRTGVGLMGRNVGEFGDVEVRAFFDHLLNRAGAHHRRRNGLLLAPAKFRDEIGCGHSHSKSHKLSARRHTDHDRIARALRAGKKNDRIAVDADELLDDGRDLKARIHLLAVFHVLFRKPGLDLFHERAQGFHFLSPLI